MMKFSIFNSGRAALVAALLLLGGVCSFAAPPSAAKSNRTVMTKKNVNKQKKMVNSFESPDFAFPETVEKNALPQWEKALKNRDGLLALRAGMQVIAARNSVSADNINANVEMLDSAIKVMPPVYASLLRLLEADLYKSFYERNRWTYNQRTLPTDTFPEDPRTWSRTLFAEKVYDIVRNATDNIMASREMPLTDITKVLGNYQTAVNAGCSVYDFIIFKSSSLLDTFTGTGDEDKYRDLSMALLTTLVNYRKNADNTPALVLAVSRKAETLPDDEHLAFLKEWKDRLAGDAADGRLINEYYQFWSGRSHEDYKEGRALRRQMEEWIARFPNASGVEAVKYSLARLTQPSIQALIPGEVLPGSEVKASLTVENAHEGYLLVYELTEAAFTNGDFNVSKFPGNAKFRKAVPVKTGGEIPFSATFDIKLGSFPAGYYVVVPSRTPSLASNWRDLADRWSIQPVNVTEIALFTNYDTNSDKSGKIYVVKATNQEPIEGAVVTITDNRNKVISSGKTLSDGSFPLPKGYSRVKATYGGSSVSTYTGFSVYRNDFKANPACSIFTDLSVYRPGDKMNFLLVEWLADRFSSRLLSGEKVDVVMRDANYNPVDTLSLTTDADGRCKGSFTIPSSGLLGRYVLEAVSEGKTTIGRTGFEVAEYKTPGFIVSLEKEGAKSYEAGDTVTFKGDAATFSGMPLADAKVQYKVSWQPWWRWGGDYTDKTFGGETVTGNDGKFSIDFATASLKGSRFEHGIFTLDVSVTSPSGETQSAPGVRF
ncbi:MAG: hypothetical protein K2G69_08475, partial [Muribaculaceae bacterium]|nr:hypothetical protein [Muribaculaceae bacterium]